MGEETVSKNFIEQIIEKDLAEGRIRHRLYPVSAGTKRLSSYRTCEIHSFKLWTGTENTTESSIMRFDDTNPTKEKDGVCRVHQGRYQMAGR